MRTEHVPRFAKEFRDWDERCEQEAWRAIDARSGDDAIWIGGDGRDLGWDALEEEQRNDWAIIQRKRRSEWWTDERLRRRDEQEALAREARWQLQRQRQGEINKKIGASVRLRNEIKKQEKLAGIRERARDLVCVIRRELATAQKQSQHPNIEPWLQIWRAQGYKV